MTLRQRGNSPGATRFDGGLVCLDVYAPEVPVAVYAVPELCPSWGFKDRLLLYATGLRSLEFSPF